MNLNKQYHIFPKGRFKWKWLMVLPLFTLIIALDLYSTWLTNGKITWSDLPLFMVLAIALASWGEEEEE